MSLELNYYIKILNNGDNTLRILLQNRNLMHTSITIIM